MKICTTDLQYRKKETMKANQAKSEGQIEKLHSAHLRPFEVLDLSNWLHGKEKLRDDEASTFDWEQRMQTRRKPVPGSDSHKFWSNPRISLIYQFDSTLTAFWKVLHPVGSYCKLLYVNQTLPYIIVAKKRTSRVQDDISFNYFRPCIANHKTKRTESGKLLNCSS